MSSNSYIVAGFSIPPTILTVIGNTVFFITLLKTNSLHTPSNILVGSLCLTDLLAGVLCQPMHVASLLVNTGPCCPPLKQAFYFTFSLSCWNSFICISLITLDRYIAICYPYRYRELVTCRKYAYAMLWVTALVTSYSILELRFYEHSKIIFLSLLTGLQFLIIFAVLIMYARIYRVVLSQRRRIASIVNMSFRLQARISSREMKRTHTVAIVLTVIMACYTPSTVQYLMYILYHTGKTEYELHLGRWANYLVLLNSCLNPIIYCARSQEIRRAAMKIFMPKSRFARDSANTVTNVETINGREHVQNAATSKV